MKTSQTKLSALEKQQTEFTAKLKQVNSQLMAENTTLRASVEDHSTIAVIEKWSWRLFKIA